LTGNRIQSDRTTRDSAARSLLNGSGNSRYLVAAALPRPSFCLPLRESAILIVCGIRLAVAASVAATRLIASQLFGVRQADPVSIAASALLMIVVGAVAAWAPAWKATRVDPITALRGE